ncbi:MAG TPA: hypothetical protein VGU66_09785 [Candidatus Elarobacter sp.]|nr:hypothetical protein [Candidatus Elarobacter sp.]
MNTRAGMMTALMLTMALTAPVGANDDHYRPHVRGKPAGSVVGTLLNYGEGMASGNVTIRKRDGTTVWFYTAAPPITIDGRRIHCPLPPYAPAYRRNRDLCSVWPSYVRIGSTRVRVPYWRGTRYGTPTLVTNEFTVVK